MKRRLALAVVLSALGLAVLVTGAQASPAVVDTRSVYERAADDIFLAGVDE